MIIYCYLLLSFFIFTIGINIGKGINDDFKYVLGGMLMYIPLIGRVLNWW